jgi:hypothetical protein
MTRVDRVLRWVWLINGVLLLALLVFAGGFVAIGALANLGGGSPTPSHKASTDSVRAAEAGGPVRYDTPVPVRGSATRIVLIRRGTGYAYSSTASSTPAGGEGAVVNVAFIDASGARLLLDRPGFIRRVRFPGREPEVAGDSTLRWIVYEMALEDSNADRTVDDRDQRSLYVTDLDGRGLRRVLPQGFELREWEGEPDGSLVVTGLELAPAPGGRMRQRAFVLDPAGAVRPYAALDSVAAQAGRIVGAP